MQKPKFKPEINRVKLNPEQAVLQCSCYDTNRHPLPPETGGGLGMICDGKEKRLAFTWAEGEQVSS